MTSTTYTCKDNDRPLIEETAQGSHGSHSSHSSHYFADTHEHIYEIFWIGKDDLKLFPYEEYTCGYVATVATYG